MIYSQRFLRVIDTRDGGVLAQDSYFVIRVRDVGAAAALRAYAEVRERQRDPDTMLVYEIRAMAQRSGPNHPKCGEEE